MLVPLSWIKQYLDIQLSPAEIANKLTLAGIEVDSYQTVNLDCEGVVVGQVLKTEKHPNADKLCVAQVTDGQETYTVVCGAANCREGLKVAFARVGATLKDENGQRFTIKQAKLRGVESFGMLCAADELHLTNASEGILELPNSTQVGTPIQELFSDTIFEISLTPNLSHCASVLGIARELYAGTGSPIHKPRIELKESPQSNPQVVKVKILDSEACPRYACRLIANVKVGPSPDWLKMRLEQCGLRSINNIVDVTNYVLLELGHPLHAFDFDRLEGHAIIVKKADEGFAFHTLDDKERILSQDDLVICDGARPIAIAGVMGGLNSEVNDKTQNVLLEAAYFDPVAIRKTSKRLGLQTDSSKRFERGTDPNGLLEALNRAAMLIQQAAGGEVLADPIDVQSKKFPEKEIACRLTRLNHVLGITLGRGEIESIFHSLNFSYHWDNQDQWVVRVPTYRVDIQTEIDLIEEVARLYGYDNIQKSSAPYLSSILPHTPIYLFEKEIRTRLLGEGLQEFLTCDLIGPSLIQIVQGPNFQPESMIHVLNPTSIEQSILRTSLLPGLLQVVKYNLDHQNHHIAGFEIGRIHFKEGEQYKEQSVAAIVLSGQSRPSDWAQKPHDYDFFDLKGIVENLFKELGITDYSIQNLKIETFHTGRQASIFVDSLEVGSIGEIHPAILRRLDVSQRVLFGEFDLQDLMQVAQRREKVKELALYPGSERDWTLTIKQTIPFEKVKSLIQTQASPLLESLSLIDIYRHEKLGHDYQNMTLRFVYRDLAKTIEQQVVEAEHQRLMQAVVQELDGAIIQK